MRKTVFLKSFLMNLLIVTTLALMSHLLIARMQSIIKNQEIMVQEAAIRQNLDYLTDEIQNMENLLTQNRTLGFFSRVLIIKEETEPSDFIALQSMQQYLQSIAGVNPDIADIITVLGNSGIVITRYNTFARENEFRSLYAFEGIDVDAFFQGAGTPGMTRASAYMAGGSVKTASGVRRNVAFCYRIPLGAVSVIQPTSFVYLLINRDTLENRFLNENMLQFGAFSLQDRSGATLMSFASAASEGALPSKNDISLDVLSGNGALRVSAYLPEAYFTHIFRNIHSYVNISLIAILAIGLLLSAYFSWRQAQPVRKLIGQFADAGQDSPELVNEYGWLRERITEMHARNLNITAALEEYQRTAQANYIERILSNTLYTPEQFQEAEAALPALSAPFRVGYGVVSFPGDHEAPELSDLRFYTFRNELMASLPDAGIVHRFDRHSFALLIPETENEEAVFMDLAGTLERLRLAASCEAVVSLSAPCDSLMQANAQFEQARARYLADQSGRALLIWDEKTDAPRPRCAGPVSLQHFFNCLRQGDAAAVRENLQSVLLQDLSVEDDLEQRYYVVRSLMMQAFTEFGIDIPPGMLPKYHLNTEVSTVQRMLTSTAEHFCSQVRLMQSERQNAKFQKILAYIDTHFTDENCCPDSVAEHFGVSIKFLYDAFRGSNYPSPAAFILNARLAEAARLLARGSINAQEAGKQSGFANYNTFYKAFKRSYGISPGQYQENCRVGGAKQGTL